ncbi:MAG TPA: FKBP-type peptidyl-prolyl cis-trans isomerase [Bacteroidales bacterium]|nr:FKBP-type peptidyl-prolyl cis-trans isomerase [Bacteroidales bacterium]
MKSKALFLARVGLFVILPAMFFAIACGTDDPERQAAKDREKILEYILQNNLNAIELPSGVFYVIEREGRGPFPTDSSEVVLTYTGTLLDGTQFDFGAQRTMFLPNSIPGFRQGVPKFNRGAKGIILVPSGLGYGPSGSFTIPPNSVLIFRVEIIDWR